MGDLLSDKQLRASVLLLRAEPTDGGPTHLSCNAHTRTHAHTKCSTFSLQPFVPPSARGSARSPLFDTRTPTGTDQIRAQRVGGLSHSLKHTHTHTHTETHTLVQVLLSLDTYTQRGCEENRRQFRRNSKRSFFFFFNQIGTRRLEIGEPVGMDSVKIPVHDSTSPHVDVCYSSSAFSL